MSVLGVRPVHARSSGMISPVRELTGPEIEEVSGGVLPLVVIGGAILIAAVAQVSGEESAPEGEDSNSDD